MLLTSRKILFGQILLALVILFSGCNNFVKGTELKELLQEEIEYYNSQVVTLRILGNDKEIKFLSGSGDISLRKSDIKNIEFQLPSDNFEFVKWNIYKKDSPDIDCSQNLSCETINRGNIFSTTIELLKDTDDLVMEAVCFELPAVKSIEPKYYPSGVSYYSNIQIEFTQPMRESELTDFSYIKIFDAQNNDITSYFERPLLQNEKTLLIIKPNSRKFKDLMASSKTFDIFVHLPSTLHEDSETPHLFKEFIYNYVVSYIEDNVNPVMDVSSLKLSKKVKNLRTNEFTTQELLSDFSDDDTFYYQNHIASGITISCSGTDIGSGVKALQIKEKTINNKNGVPVSGAETVSFIDSFIKAEDGSYVLNSCDYYLKSEDGLVQLDFCLVDYDNKESEHVKRTVVKDSNPTNTIEIDTVINSTEPRMVNESGKDVLFDGNFSVTAKSGFYKDYKSDSRIDVTYWDKGCEIQNYETFYGKSGSFTSGKPIVLNPVLDSYIKISLETDLGQKTEKVYLVPGISYVGTDFRFDNNPDTTPYEAARLYFTPGSDKRLYKYFYQEYNATTGEYGPLEEVEYDIGSQIYVLTAERGKRYKVYKYIKYNDSFMSCLSVPMEFAVDSTKKLQYLSENKDLVFPKINSVNLDKPEVNTGVCTVHVDYDGSILDYPGFKFQLYCSYKDINAKDAVYYPVSNYSFDVETGIDYEIGMAWVDEYGAFVTTKDSGRSIITSGIKNKPLDLSECGVGQTGLNYYCLKSSRFGYSNAEVEYWVEKNSTPNLQAPEFSEEKVLNLKKYKTSGSLGNEWLAESDWLPIVLDIEDGDWTVYFKIFDGPYSSGTGSSVISSYYDNKLPDVLNIKRKSTNSINVNIPDSLSVYAQELNSELWVHRATTTVSSSSLGTNITLPYSVDKFMKLLVSSTDDRGNICNSNTIYLYPDYFINNRSYTKKDFVPGRLGGTLFIDQPTLVRTLYSNFNWGDDAALWGTRGYENHKEIKNSDCSYQVVTEGIPSGYYYCIVVNFADGTSCMGDVRRMP